MKKIINNKFTIFSFCFMISILNLNNNYVTANDNLLLKVEIEEGNKYIDIESYVKLSGGYFEKKIISESKVVYTAKFLSTKTWKYHNLEFYNDKNIIKIGDKYIPYKFKTVSNYLVPDKSSNIIIKEEKVYVPISIFITLFNASLDNEGNLILSKNIGSYIENNLGDIYLSEENGEEDKEKLNTEENQLEENSKINDEVPKEPSELEKPQNPDSGIIIPEKPKPELPLTPKPEPPVNPKPEPPVNPKPEPPVNPEPEPPVNPEPEPPVNPEPEPPVSLELPIE